jgi:hypothetical protein
MTIFYLGNGQNVSRHESKNEYKKIDGTMGVNCYKIGVGLYDVAN